MQSEADGVYYGKWEDTWMITLNTEGVSNALQIGD
jgi:hypothetical protein